MKRYYDTTRKVFVSEDYLHSKQIGTNRGALIQNGIVEVAIIRPEYDSRWQHLTTTSQEIVDGVMVVTQTAEDNSIDMQEWIVSERANEKRKEALAASDGAVAAYMNQFSQVERETWSKQQAEVEAFVADPKSPTPVLDGLAAARGISREEQIEKAKAKVTAFVPLSCYIVGKQQGYEDAIKAILAEDITPREKYQKLDELVFDYSLPETETQETSTETTAQEQPVTTPETTEKK